MGCQYPHPNLPFGAAAHRWEQEYYQQGNRHIYPYDGLQSPKRPAHPRRCTHNNSELHLARRADDRVRLRHRAPPNEPQLTRTTTTPQ